MAEGEVTRKLAAIMAADVVGYSRLTSADEEGTITALRRSRVEFIDPVVASYRGRVANTAGDSLLIEFASVVDALRCAIEIQSGMADRNAGIAEERRIRFRIGINVGDVVASGGDLLGDGVNLAARIEALAEPGGIWLSRAARDQVRDRLPVTLKDMGAFQVKNIQRPVRCFAVGSPADRDRPAPASTRGEVPAAPPEKPSLAVLPFDNMSGDPEQDFFVDGLVEDIITTLSKLSGLRVIARNSTFVFKGRSVDVREAAKQLGVRYVLEGSVRRSGQRIRITTQLIDASDGAHLWAERYDRTVEDIFAVQDEVTLILATEMQVKLTEGEQARLRYANTKNVEAWTLWVQGLSCFREAVTKEKMGSARERWERALALDPDSAVLNAMLGLIRFLDARFGWWEERQAALVKARDHVERALDLDPANADAHSVSSCLHLLGSRYDEAAREARRAVELAPGSADALEFASFVLTPCGFPAEAALHSEKAIALNPNHPPVYLGNLGNAYRHAGRVEEAIAAFEAYNARSPGFGLSDLVIVHQRDGRPEEARRAARRLLEARPRFTVDSWRATQFRRDQDGLAADCRALREAGLPDS